MTVDSFDEIKASDVDIDKPYTVFVKSDLSKVQLRHWNISGQIESITYKAVKANIHDNPDIEKLREEIKELANRIKTMEENCKNPSMQKNEIN